MTKQLFFEDSVFNDPSSYANTIIFQWVAALRYMNNQLGKVDGCISDAGLNSDFSFAHTNWQERLWSLEQFFNGSYSNSAYHNTCYNLIDEIDRIDSLLEKSLDLQLNALSNLRINNFDTPYTGGELSVPSYEAISNTGLDISSVSTTWKSKSDINFDDLIKSQFGRKFHSTKYEAYFTDIYKPDGVQYSDVTYDLIMNQLYRANEFDYSTIGEKFENNLRTLLLFGLLTGLGGSLITAKLGLTSASAFLAAISSISAKGLYLIPAYKLITGTDFDGQSIDRIDPLKEILVDLGIDYLTGSLLKYRKMFNSTDDIAQYSDDIITRIKNGDLVLETTKHKGNFGEMIMDKYFESLGYSRISLDKVTSLDDPLKQGIDGIYYNPNGHPPYIIGEAKYGTSSLGYTNDGKQMSESWIQGSNRLENAVGKEQADEILELMIFDPDSVQSSLINIDSSGNVVESILDSSGNKKK